MSSTTVYASFHNGFQIMYCVHESKLRFAKAMLSVKGEGGGESRKESVHRLFHFDFT